MPAALAPPRPQTVLQLVLCPFTQSLAQLSDAQQQLGEGVAAGVAGVGVG